ncbi:DUF115 domain-containing protein [Fodinisporobacter ferrooxydans]|uniref:DUF115 domain-containing protein n=1 Tax=Fodinisporobacter ferrooxydans TaxID=2901836 RepID=A0ABY4CM86_9BACL|nr:DUF115 domain-containing protein [Alicyclobacillaceae bacterium MYW30-H2]
MTQLLEENLFALNISNKEQLNLFGPLLKPFESYKAEPAKNGETAFSLLTNGKWQALTSKYNPIQEAAIQVEKQWQDDCDLYIVFGIGGFYHIEEVLNRVSEKNKVLVIAHDIELFHMILTCRDLKKTLADSRLELFLGQSLENVSDRLEFEFKQDVFYIPKVCIIEHPVECKLAHEYYDMAKKLLVNNYRGALADMGTRVRFGDQWARNILGNLPYILQSADLKELLHAFSGKPAILVSAGPSLNKNIQLLKEVGDRALIVCVDTAYRSLYRQGIVPHLLVSVDGSESNAHDFEGVEYSGIPLVMEMTAHESIAANHTGKKLMLHSVRELTPWLEKILGEPLNPTYMPTGGSVSCTAFSIIEHLGCDPIIFIGQDLSYPDGQAYAQGAVHDQSNIEEIKKHRKLIPLQDIYGQPVYTTEDYLIYLRWFEERIRTGNRTHVNATEGGALREGLEIMTLHDVLDRYCQEEIPIQKIFSMANSKPLSLNMSRRIIRKIRQTMAQMRHMIHELQVIMNTAQEIIANIEQNSIDRIQIERCMSTIHESQRNILKYQFALLFIDAVSYREILSDINTERSLELENLSQKEKDLISFRQAFAFASVLLEVCIQSHSILDKYLKQFCERVGMKGEDKQ